MATSNQSDSRLSNSSISPNNSKLAFLARNIMATSKQSDSRLWNSHIGPNNSKWLHEDLTGMDAKFETMKGLLQPQAIDFTRRADLYFGQRPEILRMVEEAHQAYHGLAGRYDHATRELHQAHGLTVGPDDNLGMPSQSHSGKRNRAHSVSPEETISELETKITRGDEETARLNNEIAMGVERFNSAEEQHHLVYQSLKSEGDTLMQKMGMLITHELVQKDEELVNLRAQMQEEHMHLMQAEDALNSLQELHYKSQDKQRNLEMEVEDRFQTLVEMELQNQCLQDDIKQLKEENKNLRALEATCESLQQEKSALIAEKASLASQLDIIEENLSKLFDKNTLLENSLTDVNVELEASRVASKNLEESFQDIKNEKFGLLTERDSMVTKLKSVQEKLEDVAKCYSELGEKHSYLEKEESILDQVAELQTSLALEREKHASFLESNETHLASLEEKIFVLQEERRAVERDFEAEQDKAMKAQMEFFIWEKCVRDVEERNFVLLNQNHVETSKLSEKLIFELEQKNVEQQSEVKSLLNQVDKQRTGIHRVLKSLGNYEYQDKTEEDERLIQDIVKKIEDMGNQLEGNYEIAKYSNDLVPLVESIKSLEKLVFSEMTELEGSHEMENSGPRRDLHDNSSEELCKKCNRVVLDGVTDLLDLESRLKAVKNTLIKMKKLKMQEKGETSIKLKPAMKDAEDSKSYRVWPEEIKPGTSSAVVEKKRVPLRYYFYGNRETGNTRRHKRDWFCLCARPSTVEED